MWLLFINKFLFKLFIELFDYDLFIIKNMYSSKFCLLTMY